MFTTQLRFFLAARLRSFAAYWTIARWTLLVWGAINGFGIGLLGQVSRVTGRISRRVPRVSGTIGG